MESVGISYEREKDKKLKHNLTNVLGSEAFSDGRQIEISKEVLENVGKKRWFKTHELYYILNNIPSLLSQGLSFQERSLQFPSSGSFFIYEKEKSKKYWKKDKHDWVKRKNQIHVREDREKLKYNGIETIFCVYTHGTGAILQTSKTLKRRGYWLINNPHYLFVHYFDERNSIHNFKFRGLKNKSLLPSNGINPQINGKNSKLFEDEDCLSLKSNEACIDDNLNQEEENVVGKAAMKGGEKECFLFENSDRLSENQNKSDNMWSYTTVPSHNLFLEGLNNSTPNYDSPFFISQYSDCNQPIIPTPPNQLDILELQNQIAGLQMKFQNFVEQARIPGSGLMYGGASPLSEMGRNGIQPSIAQLEMQKIQALKNLNNCQYQNQYNLFPAPSHSPTISASFLKSLNIKIVDFSPEWDYAIGGAKILICISPTLDNIHELIAENLLCRFDTKEVPVTFVQGTVIKCHAPSHKIGYFFLDLVYEGELITTSNKSLRFEYREHRNYKKTSLLRQRTDDSKSDQMDSREFKIRIIEKLSNLENKINSQKTTGRDESDTVDSEKAKGFQMGDDQIAKINSCSNDELENLGRQSFIMIVTRLFSLLKEKFPQQYSDYINELDEHGVALLHYFAALDYSELIQVFKEFGADLNIKTENNLTPLIISAARGNKKTVSKLMEKGVAILETNSSESEEENKMDPLEIAIQHKHHSIVEMLLRELSLKHAVKKKEIEDPEQIKLQILNKVSGGGKDRVEGRDRFDSYTRQESGAQREKRDLCRIDYVPRHEREERACSSTPIRRKSQSNNIDIVAQKIQRNVRAWLLKRQYHDIKQAKKILHSKLNKKIDQKKAVLIIQRTVRSWLNIKFP